MLANAVRRRGTALLTGSRSWVMLTLLGLLVWTMLATATATGTGGHRHATPDEAPITELRLTAQQRDDTTFHVASFNVLGYSHTTGKKSRYESGVKRMGYAYEILRNHHVNVVGFQELQPPQLEKFHKLTGKKWAVYPGGRMENIAMHNSIAWKTRRWELRSADYINIPYFHGRPVKMPVVKLRHVKTGRAVYFANFHNPADAHGDAQKWRDQARRKQITLANRIAKTGIPLVLTGDMNEREKYFCNMVKRAPMKAANGGSNRDGRPCDTPDYMGIDWIFGSKAIRFADYRRVVTRLVNKTTDHPFIVTRATIPSK